MAFQAPLGDGLEGPLKGFGHALLLVNVQSRVADFIAVSIGEFRMNSATNGLRCMLLWHNTRMLSFIGMQL